MRWVRDTLNVVVRITVRSIRPCGSVIALLLMSLLIKRPLQLVRVYLNIGVYSAVSFVPTSCGHFQHIICKNGGPDPGRYESTMLIACS